MDAAEKHNETAAEINRLGKKENSNNRARHNKLRRSVLLSLFARLLSFEVIGPVNSGGRTEKSLKKSVI